MTSDDKKSVIKLPHKSGDYLCTWQLPDRKGGFVEVPGSLTVEPRKWPNGIVYGSAVPIEWAGDGNIVGVATFPQQDGFDAVVGRLSSGVSVSVGLCEISYRFSDQGRIWGNFAVFSLQEFVAGADPRKYSAIQFQIEGLEAVAGFAPIKATRRPKPDDEDKFWGAKVNDEANRTWQSDNASLTFAYEGSFRYLDAYEFRMGFGPVLTLRSNSPLTIFEWWTRWVTPMRRIITVATGAPRDVTYLLALHGDDPKRPLRDQVFGWNLTQEPARATSESVRAANSAVNLAEDELSLLSLTEHWQQLADEQHPIIETYGHMSVVQEQHPRSQFLLLIQALEGLYGFEHREQDKERQERHKVEREEFIERMQEVLEPKDVRYLKDYVMKYAPQGLATALIAIFKSLPVDVREEIGASELVKEIRAEDASLTVEAALAKARNHLSHGSRSFEQDVLRQAVGLLDRVVRSEALRLLGAPVAAQERALASSDR